jgi:DNA-binding beta-propeller fold protein YncE
VILGPTGLAYNPNNDTLYVASTASNAVFAIAHAVARTGDTRPPVLIFADPRLRGPLGLVLAPNGDLIVANGDAKNPDASGQQNSELIEFSPSGRFVGKFQVDPALGSAFGVAVTTDNGLLRFAAVDDATNTVSIWTFRTAGG